MFRVRAAGKAQADGPKKHHTRDRAAKAFPAPEANAELQSNIDVRSKRVLISIITSILETLCFVYKTTE